MDCRAVVRPTVMAVTTDPDAVAVLASLNEAFYSMDPGSALRGRLWAILAPVSDDGASPSELCEQVLERLPGWGLEDAVDPEEQRSAQILEAFALAHQAGEVLLRHLLAQYDASQQATSAWLALTAQDHREFRRRCKGILSMSDDDLAVILAWIFLPLTDEQRAGLEEADVSAASTFVCSWIRHFAAYYLRTSNAYNAIKHGMSARADLASVGFASQPATPEEQPLHVPLMSGAMIETLEIERAKKRRRWLRVRRGVDPAGLLTSTVIAVALLDWLWAVSVARHGGGGVALPMHQGPLPEAVFAGRENAWVFEFSHDIAALPLPAEEAQAVLTALGLEGVEPANE